MLLLQFFVLPLFISASTYSPGTFKSTISIEFPLSIIASAILLLSWESTASFDIFWLSSSLIRLLSSTPPSSSICLSINIHIPLYIMHPAITIGTAMCIICWYAFQISLYSIITYAGMPIRLLSIPIARSTLVL